MKISFFKLKKLLSESLGGFYSYSFKCNDTDDASYIQNITHWDEWGENEYSIDDYFLEDGTIKILSKEEFEDLTDGFNMKSLTKSPVEYYAINTDLDIVFAYCSNDIHYFFER